MPKERYFLTASLALLLPSCGLLRYGGTIAATEDAPSAPPSAEQLEVGHVDFVRGITDHPFVLISLEQGVRLPDDADLQAISSADGSIIHLKATGQRSPGYQVADIVSGRPRRGDRVIFRFPEVDGSHLDAPGPDDIPVLPRPQAGLREEAPSTPWGHETPGSAPPAPELPTADD